MNKKMALLIGSSEYGDGLTPLRAPLNDVAALERVLRDCELGQFDQVDVLTNPDPQTMREAIEALFCNSHKDDLVLLFFSGHGIKDDRNRLHFATRLTRKTSKGTLVKSTAVPASFIQDQMTEGRSRRQVVILDCCFSGAFAQGMTAKDDGRVDLQHQLGGQGRVVLTSTTATQYAFEQDDSDLSTYTRHFVNGIETGIADQDGDGYTSIDELHDYICQKLRESAMQPKIYAFDQGFKIFIAKAPIHDPKLRYRKEVEAIATRGKLSVVGRYMLDELRHKLGLAAADADAIEDAVLRPQRDYEKNCRTYRQAVQAALAQDPVSDRTWDELSRLQTLLGLSDEDETQIRGEIQGQLQPDGADRPAPCSTPPSPEEAADLERITYVTATVSLARSGPLGLGKLTPQVKQRSHTTEGFNEMLADGVGLVLIQIPAGQFLMGSSASEKGHWDTEGPEHTVTLAPFLMGQTAVTQAQWRAVAAYPKISVDLLPAASAQGDSHPVEQISWPEAVEFCQRLSRHTGRRYRLPSEAEWEYACRAGTVTPFHCGAMLTPELAHYGSAAQTRENPIKVGSFPANAFGLYDMHGNVWEWCGDRWHESYEGAPSDGSVWTTQRPEDDDDRRVIRGGSWMDHPSACRSAARIGLNSETQSSDLGFRVVCER